MQRFLYFLMMLLVFSCGKKQQEKTNVIKPSQLTETQGYRIPKDSTVAPEVFPLNFSSIRKIPAGIPDFVKSDLNIVKAGKPRIISVNNTKYCIPGKDTFILPIKVPAIIKNYAIGEPEVSVVKDPYIKDQNPHNFSSFSKLQGLKHRTIRCMLQDKSGNVWFGSDGGGVSRYDGKNFTHITEQQGLPNNFIWSMLEDHNGAMWFATWGGGVCRYDGKNLTRFTVKEGLPNNVVRSMLQDRDGNIWFGTGGGGVSKFDGKSFTHYTEKQGL
jgi:hypothetical protein